MNCATAPCTHQSQKKWARRDGQEQALQRRRQWLRQRRTVCSS